MAVPSTCRRAWLPGNRGFATVIRQYEPSQQSPKTGHQRSVEEKFVTLSLRFNGTGILISLTQCEVISSDVERRVNDAGQYLSGLKSMFTTTNAHSLALYPSPIRSPPLPILSLPHDHLVSSPLFIPFRILLILLLQNLH